MLSELFCIYTLDGAAKILPEHKPLPNASYKYLAYIFINHLLYSDFCCATIVGVYELKCNQSRGKIDLGFFSGQENHNSNMQQSITKNSHSMVYNYVQYIYYCNIHRSAELSQILTSSIDIKFLVINIITLKYIWQYFQS